MSKDATPATELNEVPPVAERRSFLTAAAAVVVGSVAVFVPLAIGAASFLTPLFRRSKHAQVRVALLDQVPGDGIPRFFPVVADRQDAWNRYPAQRVGAVYLIRSEGAEKPTAFTAKCPHAGCFIGYAPGDDRFKCPCHTSDFTFDGTRLRGDAEVSPRDMDTLPVELRQVDAGDGTELTEVWVEFIDFQTGHKEKIPTA
ncbi:MAG: Rieske 2Fe-2S domain-containing protein [Planctomycetota bacterium]